MIMTGVLVVSTVMVQTLSDFTPATGVAMRCFFPTNANSSASSRKVAIMS